MECNAGLVLCALTKNIFIMKNILKAMFLIGAVLFSVCAWAQNADAPTRSNSRNADAIQVVAVYPNPATERLLVEFTAEEWGENLLLRIVNSEGKTMLERKLVTAQGGNMVIQEVGELSTGNYWVQLDERRRMKGVKWQKM